MNDEVKSTETPVEETTQEEPKQEKKKRETKVTFDMRMNDFRSALQNSLDEPEFRQYIEYFGFNESRVREGMTKVENTTAAEQTKKDKKALQHTATREANAARKTAHNTLIRCISSTRLACIDNPDALEMLGLDMAIQRPFGIWKAQGDRYYKNILASEEVLAEVAKYNVPRELLEQGEKELKKAVEAHDRKKSAKAEAEHATHVKNELYKDLVEWMKDFYRIVEMAFKKNPQLKEKVNIVVPYLK